MKKLFLLGLGAAFCLSLPAHAQESFSLAVPSPPVVSPFFALEPIEGKPGVFTLKAGNYDFKILLRLLAAKTGGGAIFADEWKQTNLNLRVPLQGTVPELIENLGRFGVAVGKIGTDWVFVPTKKESVVGSVILMPGIPRLVTPQTTRPFDFDFNMNPTPGHNLSPDAKPFEFNNKRWYHVPLVPIRK